MVSVARVLGVLIGIFFLLISISLLFGGTAVIVINETLSDSDGFITTPTYQIQDTEAVAVVFESLTINDQQTNINPDVQRWISSDFSVGDFVKIKIKADNMFIGIAKSSDVSSYLTNVEYLSIVNIGFNTISYTTENAGSVNDLTTTTPVNQTSFSWIVESETGELLWVPENDIFGEDLTFVLMNLDGSAGVVTDVSVGAQIPLLQVIGVGLLIFGLILLVLAIVFFVIVAKSKGRPRADRYRIYRDPVAPVVKPEQPDVKYCANCGSIVDQDSRFCSSCGEPVFSEGVPSSKAQVDITAKRAPSITAKDILPKTQPQLPQNSFVVADWGTRFWAWLIDIILINIAIESVRWTFIAFTRNWGFITDWAFFSFGFSINGLAMLLYFTYTEGQYGTTLGKQALGLIVVNESGEKSKNFGESFISAIGKAFLLPIDVIIGLFMQDPPAGKNIPLNQRLFQRMSKSVTVFRPPEGSEPKDFLSSNLLK
jgi:uncharacterized RDD family membrane protein YckC